MGNTYQVPFQIDVKGEVAVITGGTGLIGGMFAEALAQCGAKIAVIGRSVEHGAAVVERIRGNGGEAKAFAADVMSRESLLACRKEILASFGHINILINCAGGSIKSAMVPQDQYDEAKEGDTTFFTMDAENINRELELNIYGTILPTQVFGEVMLGQENASIINMASMGSFTPLTRIPGYSAAKAAVTSWTQWAATYFAKSGIRVNCMAPGFFDSAQNHFLHYSEDGTPTPRTAKIVAATPMGKFGDVHDLGGGMLFLCDPKGSKFVTGITLAVDGGFHVYSGV